MRWKYSNYDQKENLYQNIVVTFWEKYSICIRECFKLTSDFEVCVSGEIFSILIKIHMNPLHSDHAFRINWTVFQSSNYDQKENFMLKYRSNLLRLFFLVKLV